MELNKEQAGENNLSQKAQKDYALVQKAVKGDQKAYSLLMERYRIPIFNMMYKMVSNREDADDLTLEAFGKAFSKLETYAPRYAFSTWLFKIAINNSIDHIRKKKLNLLSIDEPFDSEGGQDFSGNLKSKTLDPEQRIIRQQRMQLIKTLLKKLSLKYRLMIELRYFEGLSYDEISKELEIPLGTVKAQLFRAKQILFNLLQSPAAKSYLDNYIKTKKVG